MSNDIIIMDLSIMKPVLYLNYFNLFYSFILKIILLFDCIFFVDIVRFSQI